MASEKSEAYTFSTLINEIKNIIIHKKAKGISISNVTCLRAKEKIDDSKSLAGINLKVAEGETAKAQDLNQMGAMQISSGVKGFLGAGAKLYEGSDLFSKRQGELAGGQKALEIQSAGGMDLGEGVTNARQARRAMQDMGYTGEQIAGLGMGIVPFTPQQMAGLQSIGF